MTGIARAGIAQPEFLATAGLALAALPMLLVLIRSSAARLSWVIFGGMIVFQAPEDAWMLRLGYLAGTAACVAIALTRGKSTLSGPELRPLRRTPLILIPALLPGLMLGLANNPTSNVLRDVSVFAMIAFAPTLGIDAGMDLAPKTIKTFIVWVGLIAASAFAVDWLNRRGASAVEVDRILLASLTLGVPGFVLLITTALSQSRRRIQHAFLAALIAAGYLVSGARAALVLFVPLLALARRVPAHRMAAVGMATVLLCGFSVIYIGSWATDDPDFLPSRTDAIKVVLTGDRTDDQSFQSRKNVFYFSVDRWLEHPFLGSGPGDDLLDDTYYLKPFASDRKQSLTLDSPVMPLVKFGLVGVVGLGYVLVALLLASKRTAAHLGHVPATLSINGFIYAFVALLPLGSYFEDKGTPLAITLLTALVAATLRTAPIQATNRPTAPASLSGKASSDSTLT